MSATRYENEGTFARSAGGAAFRGGLLIAVAVAIGLLLLSTGLDDESGTVATDRSSATSTPSTQPSNGGTTGSTSTTAPVKPPAQVKVLVANGSNVVGAAKNLSDQLKADGYSTLEPKDASQDVQATTVYYTQGFQREAQRLARAVGASPATVQALPVPGPVPDVAGSNVVVVLGPDLAKPST